MSSLYRWVFEWAAERSPLSVRSKAGAMVAVLGTDLGTQQGEVDANKRDVAERAGLLKAADLDL